MQMSSDTWTVILSQLLLALVIIGVLGNILTFRVFGRKRFRDLSFAMAMRFKMISDSYVLLLILRVYIVAMLGYDIFQFNWLICKLAEYSLMVAQSVSLWLLTLAGLDRLISVSRTGKPDNIKNTKLRLVSLVAVSIYSMVAYMPKLIYSEIFELRANESTSICICSVVSKQANILVFSVTVFNLITIIFLINNILSVALLVYLQRARSRVRFMCLCKQRLRMKRDHKLVINSVALNLACFLFKLPIMIVLLISVDQRYKNVPNRIVSLNVLVGLLFFMLDNSMSFLTSWCVNSLFRTEFKRMLIGEIRHTYRFANQSSSPETFNLTTV